MKVLELFAGSCSLGRVAKSMGCEVFSSDIRTFERIRKNPAEAHIDYVVDIRDFDITKLPFKPDVVWASPPCTAFSVASCWKHWEGPKDNRIPATDKALLGIELVKKTIEIIEQIQPKYWFIENPRGMLRKQDFMQGFTRHTVTYCQYGDFRMKPTDIWTNCRSWKPRAMCKPGMPCHDSAPRSSKYSGVMRQSNAYERSKIPKELCSEIINTCLDEMNQLEPSYRQAA